MAFTCGFFNSVAHDRKYDAVQHGMIFDGIITDGIYATYLKAMVVKASENASEVIVQPGRAWFNHTWSYNDSDYPVAAPEPEVVLDRIDTLVLDVNSEDAVRNNQFLWVQGTPTSQTPEPPELIHTATHNQYPLCDVYRQAGTTMIYAADITNRVGTSDCPFVTGVLESIDIDDLLAQWDDEFHTWENATKASFEGWMVNQQSVYTAWFTALKTQMAGDVADVEAWVQTIKEIIDEETATHLQLEIDEINSMLPSGSHITVTTSDTELYSRTVTITDEDNNTVTSQFDANGVAVFKSVPYVGTLTITSTDGVRTATEVVNTPYFARYEFTLAFWSATVNIIGDSVFGGETVTITDSTTALVGTVVLNASGAGVFNATYPDTYKFSVTHGGETMEVSLAVTQETTYNVEIHAGLNYQAWLNAGRVSKSFSSLDEVLEDEKTLRQLFLVHDAVDYVASQRVNNDLTKIFNTDLAAKWINNSDYALEKFYAVADIKTVMDTADKYGYGEWCLMPQVPVMTGNTAPYGEASASSVNSDGYAWKAFDGDDTTPWSANTSASPNVQKEGWIQYKFSAPTCIKKIHIVTNNITFTDNVVVLGSNDGTNFETIDTISTISIDSSITGFNSSDIEISNDSEYLYYRVNLTQHHTSSATATIPALRTLQFYAWAPKGNVPVMTANNAPYGTASASTQYNNDYGAWRAFNGGENSNTLYWSSTSGSVSNQWLSYKFVNPVNVKRLFILGYITSNDNKMPKDCKLQYSNDGTNWNDVATFTNPQTTVRNYQDTPNNIYALYWRVFFINNYGDSQYMYVREIQFYGRELKVSVPTMTSNTAPFGTASAKSSLNSSYLPWKVFDNDASTHWYSNANAGEKDSWIAYEFTSKTKLRMAIVVNSNSDSTNIATAGTINIKDESDNVLASDIFSGGTRFSKILDISGDNVGTLFKCNIAGSNGLGVTLTTVQFYGLDYSEKEFEPGTTKKWLYDHGVDLVELESYKGSTTTSPIYMDDRNELYIQNLVGTDSNYSNYRAVGKTIDLSNYSLFRAKIGSRLGFAVLSNVSYGNSLVAWKTSGIPTSGTYNSSNYDAISYVTLPMTGTNYVLDVSSINESKWVAVFVSYQNGRGTSITELWLE